VGDPAEQTLNMLQLEKIAGMQNMFNEKKKTK